MNKLLCEALLIASVVMWPTTISPRFTDEALICGWVVKVLAFSNESVNPMKVCR